MLRTGQMAVQGPVHLCQSEPGSFGPCWRPLWLWSAVLFCDLTTRGVLSAAGPCRNLCHFLSYHTAVERGSPLTFPRALKLDNVTSQTTRSSRHPPPPTHTHFFYFFKFPDPEPSLARRVCAPVFAEAPRHLRRGNRKWRLARRVSPGFSLCHCTSRSSV